MTERSHSSDQERSPIAKAMVVVICAIPIISTLAYGAVDSWTFGLLSIPVAILALLWVADAWTSGGFSYNTSTLQLPILALIIIGAIQLLPLGSREGAGLLDAPILQTLTMDPYATRLFVIKLLMYFVFFAATLAYLPGGKRINRTAIVLVTFGTLMAFFGILQRLATPESIYGLRPTPQAIPFGTFVNQHHFAALMEMMSGLTLGLLFGGGITRERKLLLGIAAAIMGIAIIFTGSRGGLVSYLGVIAFAAVASFGGVSDSNHIGRDSRSRMRRNLLVMTAAGGLILLVLGSVLLLGGESSLLRGIGLQNQSDVTSGRAHFWGIAWQIFLANPIIGSGFDSFGVAFTRFDTWNGQFRVEQAHNDYLQALADGGMLGFACVAAFIVILVKKGVAAVSRKTSDMHRSVSTGALAGSFGILIHSFFDFPLRTPANAFFFLLFIVLAVGHSASSKRSRSN